MLGDRDRWRTGLAQPVAAVFSGGASLGAIQVGMLQALADVGVEPDLVVGTSVGALNGAVVAEHDSLGDAATTLEAVWRGLNRADVFPGGFMAQALSVARTGHLHPADGLVRLIRQTVRARDFADLARPLTVVAADALTGHARRFRSGNLVETLLAATALPGVFPPVCVDGRHYWDAGSVANVPLKAAVAAGAATIVVLDAGDVCHLDDLPRGIPDGLLTATMIAMRQRVLIEAPAVARQVPMVYLPRPCARNRSLLDLDTSAELIAPTRQVVAEFLRDEELPCAGTLSGMPHHHPEELAASAGPTPVPPA